MATTLTPGVSTLSRFLVTRSHCWWCCNSRPSNPINSPISRWISNNPNKKPGTSWQKVSKSEYPKYFNSQSKFRFPTRRDIKDFIFKGTKFLRVPESASKIKPLRVGPVPPTGSIFTLLRRIYKQMDSPSRNVMLIYRPSAFAAFFTASSYIGCTIWSYEDQGRFSSGFKTPTWRPSRVEDGGVTTISGWVSDNIVDARKKLRYWWNYQATEADKLFWPIFALNGMVFLAWRVNALATTMVAHFAASPTSRALCWPMVLSTFSHYSVTHLLMNMFVLHSFLPSAVGILGKHDTLFLYLSGGLASSLGSHIFKVMRGTMAPSLGASGAIMALLGFVCTQHPDAKLGIVFIPGFTFSADTGIKCLMAVDTAGLVFGWKLLDHAAHLSGVLYGIMFSHMHHHLEPARTSILNLWHQIRSSGR